ncbi:thermonuclease family protein (plasmid) [Sphingomonas sp. FARSPH]|nr:thermonuclease family protein [Sphingomonas sp. FARSPH]
MAGAFVAVAVFALSQQKERVQQIGKMTLKDERPQVIDGDTVGVRGSAVRVVGIDAPDDDLPHLKRVSAQVLANLVARDGGLVCSTSVFDFAMRRENQCRTNAESYGRLNLACRFQNNSASVAATMVAQGYAVDWREYSGGAYVELMQKAASQRAGLWGIDYEGMRQLAVRRATLPRNCQVDTIKK